MDIKKFQLEKKWWRFAGKYSIQDSKGNLSYKSKSVSLFKTGVVLTDKEGRTLLELKQSNTWNTAFGITEGETEVAQLKKISVFSSKEYGLYTSSGTIRITSKNWGKQINFSKEGKDIAHASAKSSMWTKIGLVVSDEEDAELYLLCVILIAYLKTRGYA